MKDPNDPKKKVEKEQDAPLFPREANLPASVFKHSRSHRVLIGNVNEPGSARRLMLAQVVISCVIFISLLLAGIKSTSKSENEKDSIIAKLKEELLLKQNAARPYERKAQLDCNLYMAPSTLPTEYAGTSLFAVNDFQKGQLIMDNFISEIALLSDNPEVQQLYCQHSGIACTTPDDGNADRSSSIIMPHLTTLIKPHPYLYNVQFIPGTQQLMAVKSIRPGEELFSSPDMVQDYPSEVAPTLLHYQLANNIRRDVLNTFISITNIAKPKKQSTSNMQAYIFNPNYVSVETEEKHKLTKIALQQLTLKTVSHFDATTASLIPSSFLDSTYTSEYHAMKNHSIDWLDQHSHCYDNALLPKVKKDNKEVFVVAKRFIAKNEVITQAPVLVINLARKQEQLLDKKFCLTHDQSSAAVCISSYATYMIRRPSCADENKEQREKSSNDPSCIRSTSNAKCSWSTENKVNEKYLKQPMGKENKLESTTATAIAGMTMDFIATRDIYPHEEIFIDYYDIKRNSNDLSDDDEHCDESSHNTIFPKQWKF